MCVFSKRLSENIQAWKNIKCSQVVKEWITNGVQLPFTVDCIPEYQEKNYSFTNKEYDFLSTEIRDLEIKGAIERVPGNVKPHCVSPIKCVPKKSGKLRLITDLRGLNAYVDAPKFSNEGINTVSELVQKGDRFIKTDLKDGFQHIPIHQSCRTYLGFQFRGIYYVWCVLPFGLTCSPYYFHKCLRPIVTFLREQGIRVVLYVDDCLVIAPLSCITDHKDFVIQTFEDLGFVINYEKSVLDPSTKIEFIGHLISSEGQDGEPWIFATSAKLRKLRKDIGRALDKGRIQARFLAKITGQAIYVSKAILPGKLKLRSLYALLRTKTSWSDILFIDECAKEDLHWWLSAIREWNGSPLKSQPIQMQISTDASDTGWGAVCGTYQASGAWSPDIVSEHINYKELLAVLFGLQSFSTHVEGQSIEVLSDNVTTVAYINNMGGPVMHLTEVAEWIWRFILEKKSYIVAKHIAGVLNTGADYLSRLPTQYEWMLNPVLFQYIDGMWGPHSIDRFASYATTQLQTYNSRFLDPQTSGVDALGQQDWHSHNNWVNPPFRLLNKVIEVIIQQKAWATLIAPRWPGQAWYRKMQSLVVAPPFRIHQKQGTLIQMGQRAEPLKNRHWKIYAWRIYGGKDSHD